MVLVQTITLVQISQASYHGHLTGATHTNLQRKLQQLCGYHQIWGRLGLHVEQEIKLAWPYSMVIKIGEMFKEAYWAQNKRCSKFLQEIKASYTCTQCTLYNITNLCTLDMLFQFQNLTTLCF